MDEWMDMQKTEKAKLYVETGSVLFPPGAVTKRQLSKDVMDDLIDVNKVRAPYMSS